MSRTSRVELQNVSMITSAKLASSHAGLVTRNSLCCASSVLFAAQPLQSCSSSVHHSFLSIASDALRPFWAAIGCCFRSSAASHRSLSGMAQPARSFQLVVAADQQNGIGKDGGLPWPQGTLPRDMKYFKDLTSTTRSSSCRNAVIMGRRTWESIPDKFRPLPGRLNIILSRQAPPSEDGENSSILSNTPATPAPTAAAAKKQQPVYAPSLDAAMQLLEAEPYSSSIESVFVIGGGQVYAEALASPRCSAVHLTKVESTFDCDTFFPNLDADPAWRVWSASEPHRDNNIRYSFLCYVRNTASTSSSGGAAAASGAEAVQQQQQQKAEEGPPQLPPSVAARHEEYQYLDLVRELISEGVQRGDRTGTGTLSKFGRQMRWNLRHTFPLLTTKRVFWRGVVEELLWFISGSTNARHLSDKGVHIWDGNSSRAYLDSVGLGHREEGDLGPVYGFQWRHFGAEYTNMHADYTGQGVDQLADLVGRIKATPEDRRLILTAWNPAALRHMALPPCHMMCQFYVADGELSCQLYQRSADVGLGVPFNIASYALLTCMVAQVCGLRPGDFVHTLGDAHVYLNHVEPLKQQLGNAPRPFPRLAINPAKTDIDAFDASDFTLLGYAPHKTIKMEMAV